MTELFGPNPADELPVWGSPSVGWASTPAASDLLTVLPDISVPPVPAKDLRYLETQFQPETVPVVPRWISRDPSRKTRGCLENIHLYIHGDWGLHHLDAFSPLGAQGPTRPQLGDLVSRLPHQHEESDEVPNTHSPSRCGLETLKIRVRSNSETPQDSLWIPYQQGPNLHRIWTMRNAERFDHGRAAPAGSC